MKSRVPNYLTFILQLRVHFIKILVWKALRRREVRRRKLNTSMKNSMIPKARANGPSSTNMLSKSMKTKQDETCAAKIPSSIKSCWTKKWTAPSMSAPFQKAHGSSSMKPSVETSKSHARATNNRNASSPKCNCINVVTK